MLPHLKLKIPKNFVAGLVRVQMCDHKYLNSHESSYKHRRLEATSKKT